MLTSVTFNYLRKCVFKLADSRGELKEPSGSVEINTAAAAAAAEEHCTSVKEIF